MFDVTTKLCVFIRAQSAENVPPLGTILGNLGVNSLKFCKDFNEFTKELPNYFVLKVFISILEDRSYRFEIFLPSIGYLLSFLKFKETQPGKKFIYCITLRNVIQLCLFKFPFLPLNQALPMVIGSVNSCNILIV